MAEQRYRIQRTEAAGVRRLAVAGELDMDGVSALLEAIQGWAKLDRIVIDTTDLTFIESVGLAALVSIRSAVGPDRFHLVAGPATERLLDLTGTRPFLAGK